jgi:signal recognition particle subunit SRP19
MRKQDKIILWPVYFDSTKTRLEGRRVPKRLATPSPKLDVIKRAVQQQNLQPEVVPTATHPSTPWQETGYIVINKGGSKTKIIYDVAKRLQHLARS